MLIGEPESSVGRLVESAREGNRLAFNQLMSNFHDCLYNYIARMVHDPIEAEDITQEAFIKAYRNLPGFRGASTFQTWLYRIASNLIIDSFRRRKKRENTCSLDAPLDTEEGSMAREQEDSHEPGPQRSLEVDELRRQVHKAIRQLSQSLGG